MKKILLNILVLYKFTLYNMVKRNKKNTKDTPRKKTKASTSMDDIRRDLSADFDIAGSLPQTPQDFQPVSTILPSTSEGIPLQSSHNPSDSATILAYLKKIDASNEALTKRVQDLEANRLGSQHQTILGSSAIPVSSQPLLGAQASAIASTARQLQGTQSITVPAHEIGRQGVQETAQYFSRDGVMPDISVLRQNPHISQSVSQILAAYDVQARQDSFQGKIATKKSGRFNTTDTVTSIPELRWPNEGYLGVSAKKRIPYDDLSVTEWAVGQLSNVFHIQDTNLARQALLQVILALKDATSLPWEAVRSAWGNSMHEIEQGTLSWEDNVQWSLNRLSASQIALANARTVNQPSLQRKDKICKFYNQGSCSHESSHGNFRHHCSFCARSGRILTHPEVKCNTKLKQEGQTSK